MVVRGSDYERQDREFYPTPAWVTELIVNLHRWSPKICDPCCGDGAMTAVFSRLGYRPYGIDIKPLRAVGRTVQGDFTTMRFPFKGPIDIVSNPPFGQQGKLAERFIARSLDITREWSGSVAMLLPVDFDSGSTRTQLFGRHPAFFRKTTLLRRVKWFEGPVRCRKCDGRGHVVSGMERQTCASCNGKGEKVVGPSNNHALFFWDWKLGGKARIYDYAA